MSRFIFGPVPSRRLGFSLGIDIIPPKYCCFDCIYCQIGKTSEIELSRRSFFDPYQVVNEVADVLVKREDIDYITFSGSGEPTMNSDLGAMITAIKKITDIPVAVITNGALLYQPDVRTDLMHADAVLPSLDGVSEDVFRRINRPHAELNVDTIIRGLKLFRKEYTGKIWLEIMFIKGINDSNTELNKFKEVINELGVDKIQLNTVTRPPSDTSANRLTEDELERICHFIGPTCETISSFNQCITHEDEKNWSVRILEIVDRRSLTLEDIVRITGVPSHTAQHRLQRMELEGQIKSYAFNDNIFYMKS